MKNSKKVLSLFICLLLSFSCFAVVPTNAKSENRLIKNTAITSVNCDFDKNGSTDANDLIVFQKLLIGTFTASADETKAFDMNNDSFVNILDLIIFKKAIMNLENANIPNPDSWEYVMAWDLEDKDVGHPVSTWGGYNTACDEVLDIVGDKVLDYVGADGTKGLRISYDVEKAYGEDLYIQPYYAEGPDNRDFTGATELWFWLDMSKYHNPQDLLIKPLIGRIKTKLTEVTMTPDAPFYMQTENGWRACRSTPNDNDSRIPGKDLNGFKGYIRIPLTSFRNVPENLRGMNIGYQVYRFSFLRDEVMEYYLDNGFVMDNWMLVGPDMKNVAANPVTKLFDGSLSPFDGAMKAFIRDANEAVSALPPLEEINLTNASKVYYARNKVNLVDERAYGLIENYDLLLKAERKIRVLNVSRPELVKTVLEDFNDLTAGSTVPDTEYDGAPAPQDPKGTKLRPVAGNGYENTNALTMYSSRKAGTDRQYSVYKNGSYFSFNNTDFSGKNIKYFEIWVDFSTVAFRKIAFRLRKGGLSGKDYFTDNFDGYDNMVFFIQQNGKWVEKSFGGVDGCIEDFGKYKGYIRIPMDYFVDENKNPINTESSAIDCFGIWFSLRDYGMVERDIVIDEIGFIG